MVVLDWAAQVLQATEGLVQHIRIKRNEAQRSFVLILRCTDAKVAYTQVYKACYLLCIFKRVIFF